MRCLSTRVGRILSMMLVSVMLFASSAAACAWVLWGHGPLEAFESKALCDAEQKRAQAAGNAEMNRTGKLEGVSYVCLPDTLDRRGPKGR